MSVQSGTYTYSTRFEVPPGRNGMEPRVGLSYRSDAPIYGGVAAGWVMDVPTIALDTRNGVLVAGDSWTSGLAGGERLLRTDESGDGADGVFRARGDATGTRYEHQATGQPFEWLARSPDGSIFRFGRRSSDAPSGVLANLAQVEDAAGNVIDYRWYWLDIQIAPKLFAKAYFLAAIDYTSNPSAGLPAFAHVQFKYDTPRTCVGGQLPVGSQLTVRTGTPIIEGYFRLRSVTTSVAGRSVPGGIVHEYNLVYRDDAERCDLDVAPRRELTAIKSTGWSPDGTSLDAAPITFNYYPLEHRGSYHEEWQVGTSREDGELDTHASIFIDHMLVDMDGDGLPDRVVSPQEGDCHFYWQRNTGTGFEEQRRWVDRPSLPYGTTPPNWALAGTDGGSLLTQRCGLNVQYTLIKSPGLPDPDAACTRGDSNYRSGSVVNWRFMDVDHDGLVDMVAGVDLNPLSVDGEHPGFADEGLLAYDLERVSNASFTKEVDGLLATARAQHDGEASFECEATVPRRVGSWYQWLIYRNEGGGRFSEVPMRWGMPLPLVAAATSARTKVGRDQAGDTPYSGLSVSEGGAAWIDADPFAVVDIDGDGLEDLVSSYKTPEELDGTVARSQVWEVMRGRPDGMFEGRSTGIPYVVHAPAGAHANGVMLHGGDPELGTLVIRESTANGLEDLNGDGVPDFVWMTSDDYDIEDYQDWNVSTSAWLGNGTGVLTCIPESEDCAMSANAPQSIASGAIANLRGRDRRFLVVAPFAGLETSTAQFLDVDRDGRVDMVQHGTVRLNAGGWFLPPRPLDPAFAHAADQLRLAPAGALRPYDYALSLLRDLDGDGTLDPVLRHSRFLDSDGDGRVDGVDAPTSPEPGPGTWSVVVDTHEPRGLLHWVDNGLGGRTYVDYASVRDDWVVPDWHLPAQRWVVSSVESSAGDGTPAMVTRYHYAEPAWTRDDDSRYGFHGFGEVRTDTPTGAQLTMTFDYTVFHGGLLVETVLSDGTVPGTPPRRINLQEWQRLELHTVPFFVVGAHEQRTCGTSEDLASCRAHGALLRTEVEWRAVPASGPPLLFAAHAERTGTTTDLSHEVGTVTTITEFRALATGGAYRVQPGSVERTVHLVSGEALIGHSDFVYEPELRWLDEVRVRVDAQRVAATRYTHDLATGLLLTTELPESVAAGAGHVATLTYDQNLVYARTRTNEVGHVTEMTLDPGTGRPLSSKGPQYKCTGFWTPCTGAFRQWRTTMLRYDGLGRIVSRSESFDSGDAAYDQREVQRWTYNDWNGVFPATNTTIVEHRIDAADVGNWTRVDAVRDGLGRLVRETAHTFDANVPDAQTVYRRDGSGLVTSVETPDSSRVDGARVTTYQRYDGLGRPVAAWHSSGLGGKQRTSYDGLWTEQWLEVQDAGPSPHKRIGRDVYGHVTRVEEATSSGDPAITEYAYDQNDNLVRIVDADGLVTALEYDLAGDRVAIARGTRRWSLEYDLQGRSTSLTVPHGDPQDTRYTSRTTYDPIGRIATHTPGPGELSIDDQLAVGLGTIRYGYDGSASALGNASLITSPAWSLAFNYDAGGHIQSSSQRFLLGWAPQDARTEAATYNALGAPAVLTHADGTQAIYSYDRRGLPAEVRTPQAVVAAERRNSAGLVVGRTLSPSFPVGSITWTYDALGRPTHQEVRGRVSSWGFPGIVGSQTTTYYDSGDVRHVNEVIVSSGRSFDYTYDRQSQILGARDNRGYLATNVYTPAGRLLGAKLTVPATADIQGRDVFYDYEDADIERVRALVGQQTGAANVQLSHDDAGNTTSEVVQSGPETTYRYDGEGRLRVVVRGNDREIYCYGPGGRRVLAGRYHFGALAETRRWVGDVEVTKQGNVTTTDATIRLGAAVARRHNGQIEYIAQTLTGNTMLVLDSTGVPTAGFSYGAFGEILEQQRNAWQVRHRFQDRVKDDLSGWYDYGERLYDPQTLLWNRADPLYRIAPDAAGTDPRRMGLYTFNLNNPLRYIDPDGRSVLDAIGAFFARAWDVATSALSDGYHALADGVGAATAGLQRISDQFMEGAIETEYANVGPCSYDCAKPNPSREEVFYAVAAVATIFIAPEFEAIEAAEGAAAGAAVESGAAYGGGLVAESTLTEAAVASGAAAKGGLGPGLQGTAGVERAVADLEAAGGHVLGREVMIEAGGVRTRLDLYVELPTKQEAFLEVKTGPSATWTKNQAAAIPQIWTQGGIPRGANAAAAGLTPGVPIGPTPVWTVHYPWPLP